MYSSSMVKFCKLMNYFQIFSKIIVLLYLNPNYLTGKNDQFMGMIDQHTIQKIYDAIDIVDVISDYVALKRAGSNYKGRCPFHNEKTPSFMVSPAKGIYKCFGCGASGQAVKFIMEHDGLSYPEALRSLAKRYNIEITEEKLTPEVIEARKEQESLQVISEFAERFFTEMLWNTEQGKAIAQSYFKEREISETSIKKFKLGWSPEVRDAFTKHALKKGYKLNGLVKTGLTIDKGNYQFDRFAGRVIFPIHSISGKVLGFGGRSLQIDKKTAKYLNSPESEIYHKSKVLYGIFHAKNAIIKQKTCYVVEGYTDVISLVQVGIENVVSSSGTALTSEQIKLIRRFTENITLIFDGDPAGLKASLRGIDLVLQEEMNVKIVVLPEGEDPDTFARNNGAEKTVEFFKKNEKDFISFKTSLLKTESKNDPVERARNIQSIIQSIAMIPNVVLRNEYMKQCSIELEVDEKWLYEELRKKLKKKIEDNRKFQTRENRKNPIRKAETYTSGIYSESGEKEILHYLLIEGNEKLYFNEENGEEQIAGFIIREMKNSNLEFRNPAYKQIFNEFDKFLNENSFPDEQYFLRHEQENIRNIAAEIYAPKRELSVIWNKKGEANTVTGSTKVENIINAIEKYKLKMVQVQIETIDKAIRKLTPEDYETKLNDLLEQKKTLDQFKYELTSLTDKSPLL